MGQKKWTNEELCTIALQFTTKQELRSSVDNAYQAIMKRGLDSKAFAHMAVISEKWTNEKLITLAKSYESKAKFKAENPKAYKAIGYYKLQDIAYAHMRNVGPRKWTKAALISEIAKYGSRQEFREHSINAYDAVKRNRWVEELLGQFPDWRQEKRVEKIIPIDNNIKGIYILYNKTDIVYVGKTANCLYNRLLKHLTPGNKEYKAITSLELFEIENSANRDVAEIYLINKYKPVLNSDCNGPDELTIAIPNIDAVIDKSWKFYIKDNKCIPHKY